MLRHEAKKPYVESDSREEWHWIFVKMCRRLGTVIFYCRPGTPLAAVCAYPVDI